MRNLDSGTFKMGRPSPERNVKTSIVSFLLYFLRSFYMEYVSWRLTLSEVGRTYATGTSVFVPCNNKIKVDERIGCVKNTMYGVLLTSNRKFSDKVTPSVGTEKMGSTKYPSMTYVFLSFFFFLFLRGLSKNHR